MPSPSESLESTPISTPMSLESERDGSFALDLKASPASLQQNAVGLLDEKESRKRRRMLEVIDNLHHLG